MVGGKAPQTPPPTPTIPPSLRSHVDVYAKKRKKEPGSNELLTGVDSRGNGTQNILSSVRTEE